jgi:hypothetical protein
MEAARSRRLSFRGLCRRMPFDAGPAEWKSDIHLLYAARGLRGVGDGFAVVILPAYLSALGFTPVQIGFIATVSLFGTAPNRASAP